MTKEELEKEAEEYAENINLDTKWNNPRQTIEQSFIAGAKLMQEDINNLLDVINNQDVKIADLEWQLQEVAKDNDYYQTENKRLEKENAVLERRIERAKGCMKKLLFIINSDPANYNCKGLVQDAEDFIYNRTCHIRKSGNHCITNEPCIMCDK